MPTSVPWREDREDEEEEEEEITEEEVKEEEKPVSLRRKYDGTALESCTGKIISRQQSSTHTYSILCRYLLQ